MMDKDSSWIDNSDGDVLQYDFSPPGHWTSERTASEQAAIAASIEAMDVDAGADTDASAPGWLRLVQRLPGPLRKALLAELRAGNRLAGIGRSGWPDEGSIVVSLRERFCALRQALPQGVAWRELDDPHYAREELSQKSDGVEFLIIT